MQTRLAIFIIISVIVSSCANINERCSHSLNEQTPAETNPFALAECGVASNAEWTPYTQEFDGVVMTLVPAGCFMMGSAMEQIRYAVALGEGRMGLFDEEPSHKICFNLPFWFDQYEVSNAQFTQFDGVAALNSSWTDDNLPRERITWTEAHNFCILRDARLPTEAEWEYAARGPDNLIYPWGNEFDATRVNLFDDYSDGYPFMAPIDTFPNGISWIGAYQLSGNVWEWTSSIHERYPYNARDGRERDTNDRIGMYRIVRGGSLNMSLSLRSAYRNSIFPDSEHFNLGFRCARTYSS